MKGEGIAIVAQRPGQSAEDWHRELPGIIKRFTDKGIETELMEGRNWLLPKEGCFWLMRLRGDAEALAALSKFPDFYGGAWLLEELPELKEAEVEVRLYHSGDGIFGNKEPKAAWARHLPTGIEARCADSRNPEENMVWARRALAAKMAVGGMDR